MMTFNQCILLIAVSEVALFILYLYNYIWYRNIVIDIKLVFQELSEYITLKKIYIYCHFFLYNSICDALSVCCIVKSLFIMI